MVQGVSANTHQPQRKEGQEENWRVEIRSTDPGILSPMTSVYLAAQIDTPALTVCPSAIAPRDIARWKIIAANPDGNLADLTREGAPGPEVQVPLPTKDLQAIGTGDDIAMMMKLQDSKGYGVVFSPGPVKVTYIQTSQRLAKAGSEGAEEIRPDPVRFRQVQWQHVRTVSWNALLGNLHLLWLAESVDASSVKIYRVRNFKNGDSTYV